MTEPVRVGLGPGDPAPPFTARSTHGQQVESSDLRGRPLLLFFYPFAFTGICTGELHALRDRYAEFDAASVYAVSTDSMYALRTFAEAERLPFELLSDFWPHGEIARAYGVFDEEVGCALRGSFLVDADGSLAWSVVNDLGTARAIDDHVAALAALSG